MSQSSTLKGKRVAYFTLGCKLNFAETATIAQMLTDAGAQKVSEGEVADICIVNTCSVTEVADHKCRQAIRGLVRRHPGAVVLVTGCYAQLQPEQVAAIEGVDIVLGQDQKGQVLRHLEQHFAATTVPPALSVQAPPLSPSPAQRSSFNVQRSSFPVQRSSFNVQRSSSPVQRSSFIVHRSSFNVQRSSFIVHRSSFVPSCSCGDRTRYFLKVQDGCDYFCTYCTIPFARGRSRNGTVASLVGQARRAAAEGGREIVITGVNIGDFGRTTGETLLDLLRALDAVEGIQRYRISSIEPNLLTDEVLDFCAHSRAFMPHFHIPLQSGSDEVLRLMHRRYDTAFFYNKVSRVRELMPDAFIGVDVIVGTRGETAALFDEAERFILSLPVSQLHVFSYSERPGTAALRIPHVVRPEEKHERSQRLLAISDQKLQAFYQRFLGRTRPVLLEHTRTPGLYGGFTDNYIRVEYRPPQPPTPTSPTHSLDNQILPLRLVGWNADHDALMAEN